MLQTSRTHRRDFLEEFNRNIQSIESVQTEVEKKLGCVLEEANSLDARKHTIQARLSDGLLKMRSLLDNDYFRFMFTNNCVGFFCFN